MTMELPMPTIVDSGKWNSYLPILIEQVNAMLAHGFVLLQKREGLSDPTMPYFKAAYKGTQFNLLLRDIHRLSITEFKAFLRVLDEALDKTAWLNKKDAIFYSDVLYSLQPWHGFACRHLLYSIVCDIARFHKVRIFS